jgi:hypothetical protein
MIQMLPAIVLYFVWQGFLIVNINILPPQILLPVG